MPECLFPISARHFFAKQPVLTANTLYKSFFLFLSSFPTGRSVQHLAPARQTVPPPRPPGLARRRSGPINAEFGMSARCGGGFAPATPEARAFAVTVGKGGARTTWLVGRIPAIIDRYDQSSFPLIFLAIAGALFRLYPAGWRGLQPLSQHCPPEHETAHGRGHDSEKAPQHRARAQT